MKRLLALLALAALTFAATAPPPAPLLPSSIYVYPLVSNVTLGKWSTIVLKVCNAARMPTFFSSITFEGKNVYLSPAQLAVGMLRAGQCETFRVRALATNKNAVVAYTISSVYMIGASRTVTLSKGSFALNVLAPSLILSPLNASEVGGRVKLTVSNAGLAPFKGTLVISAPFYARLKLSLPPGGSKSIYVTVPPLTPGSYALKGVAVYGTVKLPVQGSLSVYSVPSVKLLVGKEVTLCFPKETVATVRISTSSGTPEPASTTVTVKGCKKIKYEILFPSLPVKVLVKVNIGKLSLNATAEESDYMLSVNSTTLWAGYTNYLYLNVSTSLPLKGVVSLTPSSGALNPPTLGGNGAFAWNLPASAKTASLKVSAFGRTKEIKFNVVPFNPSFSTNFAPKAVTEGSTFKAKACIINTWSKALNNVQAQLIISNLTVSKTFKVLKPNERVCVSGIALAPWGSKSLKATLLIRVATKTIKYDYDVNVLPNPYVADLAISTETKALNPGNSYATITIANVGRGYAKNMVVEFSSPQLLYPSFVYVGNLKPGEVKKIKVYFSVPKGLKQVDLKVSATYCSGPLHGTCNPSSLNKTLTFSVSAYVPPQLAFSSKVPSLVGGRTGNVVLKIVNVGGDVAKNLILTISSNELTVITNYVKIAELPPGSVKTVTIKVSAPNVEKEEKASLKVKARFTDSWGSSYQQSYQITLTVKPKGGPRVGINLLNSLLKTGNNVLTFMISNAGNSPARGVKVTLFATGVSLKRDRVTIKVIGPQQSVPWKVPCYAASTGTYSISAVVSYGNTTNIYTFKVKVVNGPQFELQSYAFYPSKLYPGTTAVLSFTIFNSGDQAAARVKVKVEAKGLKVVGSDTVTFPEIGAYRAVPLAFTLLVPPDASPGPHQVLIKVTYSFGGQTFTKVFSLSANVLPQVSVAQSAMEYILKSNLKYVLLALIVVALLLFLRKRKKRVSEVVIEE